MTLTSLVITNAVLAAVLVYGLVHFLTYSIHADRRLCATRTHKLSALTAPRSEQIAA